MDHRFQLLQKLKQWTLQRQQRFEKEQQGFQKMQQHLDMLYSCYMQHFDDVQHFTDRRQFMERRQYLELLHCLDMGHSDIQYLQRNQQVQHVLHMRFFHVTQHLKQLLLNHSYEQGPMHGNSRPGVASTTSADQDSCRSQHENRPASGVQRYVHHKVRCYNNALDSSQYAVPYSVGREGIASPLVASFLGTSTADSYMYSEENGPILYHQKDDVNKSRDVRILQNDVLKICNALLKLRSMLTDLREKNTKLGHFMSLKSQVEDIDYYLQEIRQQVQYN